MLGDGTDDDAPADVEGEGDNTMAGDGTDDDAPATWKAKATPWQVTAQTTTPWQVTLGRNPSRSLREEKDIASVLYRASGISGDKIYR